MYLASFNVQILRFIHSSMFLYQPSASFCCRVFHEYTTFYKYTIISLSILLLFILSWIFVSEKHRNTSTEYLGQIQILLLVSNKDLRLFATRVPNIPLVYWAWPLASLIIIYSSTISTSVMWKWEEPWPENQEIWVQMKALLCPDSVIATLAPGLSFSHQYHFWVGLDGFSSLFIFGILWSFGKLLLCAPNTHLPPLLL